MKSWKTKMFLMLALSGMIFTCRKGDDHPSGGTVKDPDGKTYEWKRMADNRVWMVDNLAYDIPGHTSLWYDYDPANGEKYGRLYDWQAAKAACKALGDGWRLSASTDWEDLVAAYGGWEAPDNADSKNAYAALIEGGSSGFNALLAGWRSSDGSFFGQGGFGSYWSATDFDSLEAWGYFFNGNVNLLYRYFRYPKSDARSCRCVSNF